MTEVCPLCAGELTTPFFEESRRSYLRCGDCRLVFVPARFHLSTKAEKAEYELHRNDPSDVGYRKFLSRLATPLLEYLPSHARGLDFGCGPGPTLSVMLQEAGFEVDLFDPLYANDTTVFERKYDFITATEVVEHLRQPGMELDRLFSILSPGGILGVMTKRVRDREAFVQWHYKNDPTHICFFSEVTFDWLAQRWGAELEVVGDDVVLFKKST